MAKNPPNHGKSWSTQDVSQLKTLSKENTPTRRLSAQPTAWLMFLFCSQFLLAPLAGAQLHVGRHK